MGVESGLLVCMAAATWRSYAGLGDDWPSAARSGCGKGLTRGRARSDSEPRLSVTLAGREDRFVPYMKLKTSHPRQTVYLGLVLYVVVQFSLWKGDNTDL